MPTKGKPPQDFDGWGDYIDSDIKDALADHPFLMFILNWQDVILIVLNHNFVLMKQFYYHQKNK
eukprot:UN08278